MSNSITLTDIYIDIAKRNKLYFDNYLGYVKNIKGNFEKLLGEVRVYVFGSVISGNYSIFSSDIDILIISDKAPNKISEKSLLIIKALKEIGFPNPFQIHLITPNEYENWYKNFIKENYREI